MKVLVFTSLFPNNIWPNHGVFVKERICAVARSGGCEIRVVAPVPYPPPLRFGSRWMYSRVAREEMIGGIRVFHPRYFLIPKISMPFHGLMMFFSVLRLIKRIKAEFDFDVIDAHYVFPDGLAAVLLGIVFEKPVVVTARGSDINVVAEMPLMRRLVRYTLANVAGVIAVSQALKTRIVGLGIPDRKVTVIPNGVDLEKFHPMDKTAARQRLGLPGDKKVLLSVGGLDSVKGFDRLIQAVRILIDEFGADDILLLIAGEGGLRRKLLSMVTAQSLEAHVRLVGAVPHEELRTWYSAADLFCLASRSEGWPNVVLESLACGTPVIATAVGGIPEIITSDSLGLLVHSGERQIAAQIHNAFCKEWRRTDIASAMKDRTWDRVARLVVRNLKGAVTGGQTPVR